MELKNTSCLPDYFIRRMIRWCCKEVGYSARMINEATFTNRQTRTRLGTAWIWSGKISVHVGAILGPKDTYDYEYLLKGKADLVTLSGWMQLVETTAHEIAHLFVFSKYGWNTIVGRFIVDSNGDQAWDTIDELIQGREGMDPRLKQETDRMVSLAPSWAKEPKVGVLDKAEDVTHYAKTIESLAAKDFLNEIGNDQERVHLEADRVLILALKELGLGEIAEAWEHVRKTVGFWYS